MTDIRPGTGLTWGSQAKSVREKAKSSYTPATRVAAAVGIAMQIAAVGQAFAADAGVTAPGVSSTPYARPNDSVGGVTQATSSNIAMQCGSGLVLSGGACVPMPVPTPPPNCAYGQVYSGGSCVPVSSLSPPPPSCPSGTTLSGGSCVPFMSPPPPPPANCTSKTVSWGAACTGTAAATTHGSSRSVSSYTSYTGTATFVCNDGNLYYSSGSCNAPAPVVPPPPPPPPPPSPTPPPSCAAKSGPVSWGAGCSASVSVGATPSGGSVGLTNSAAGYTGSATYSCSSGAWSVTSNTCTLTPSTPPPPPSCASQTVSWSGPVSGCSGTIATAGHGIIKSVTKSVYAGSPYYGSASFQCVSGSWVRQSGTCEFDAP